MRLLVILVLAVAACSLYGGSSVPHTEQPDAANSGSGCPNGHDAGSGYYPDAYLVVDAGGPLPDANLVDAGGYHLFDAAQVDAHP